MKYIQSDHILLDRMLKMYCESPKPTIDDLDRISKSFRQIGGSWENVILGDIDELSRLKKLVKFAYQNGYVTKKAKK